jgi:hypothetical protein
MNGSGRAKFDQNEFKAVGIGNDACVTVGYVGYSEAMLAWSIPLITRLSLTFAARFCPSSPLHLVQSHFLYCPTTSTRSPSCKILPFFTCTAITSSVGPSPHYTGPLYSRISSSPQVVAIISSAIICSAAAWNLPISQNANFHSKGGRTRKGIPHLIHSQLSRMLTPT